MDNLHKSLPKSKCQNIVKMLTFCRKPNMFLRAQCKSPSRSLSRSTIWIKTKKTCKKGITRDKMIYSVNNLIILSSFLCTRVRRLPKLRMWLSSAKSMTPYTAIWSCLILLVLNCVDLNSYPAILNGPKYWDNCSFLCSQLNSTLTSTTVYMLSRDHLKVTSTTVNKCWRSCTHLGRH